MLDIPFIFSILPRLTGALALTILVSGVSLVLGTFFGMLLGVVKSMSRQGSITRFVIDAFVWVVRGTPVLVQIFAFFFLLPKMGIKLDVFWVGVIALTFNSAGYQVEIVRAAIESIGRGQHEAAMSIGMSRNMAMRFIILPQAARRMIPPLTNELANLVKASSALSVIALFELTKASNAIIAGTFKFTEVLIVEAVLYFAVIHLLVTGARMLEQRAFGANAVQVRHA
jgi:polar amino acid transport system permease protein